MQKSMQATTADPVAASPARTAHGDRTHREILSKAADLASSQGLEGLTIGSLAKALDMSKSGLFAHFGSKQELQLAVVDTAAVVFAEKVVAPSLEAPGGVVRLYALLDAWVGYVESKVFSGGCFWAAVASEFDGRPGVVRDRIVELSNGYAEWMKNEIQRARHRGQLRASVDASQLTFQFHAYVHGYNWASQLHGDHDAASRARLAIRRCIEDAATQKGVHALAAFISKERN